MFDVEDFERDYAWDLVHAAAVGKGAAFLDLHVPDWYMRIKPELLDIKSPHQCVCGHVFHDMWMANTTEEDRGKAHNNFQYGHKNYSPFHFAISEFGIAGDECVELGFDFPEDWLLETYGSTLYDEIMNESYSTLAEMWIEAAEKRRANAGKML